jgi:small-conductance mechanosensitive channel
MTRISSDSIRLIAREQGPVFFDALYRWRNPFVYGIRIYAFFYLFVYRFLAMDTLFLMLVRILAESLLAAGVVLFWKAYEKSDVSSGGMGMRVLRFWTKTIVFSGLVADIAGYGSFACFWFVSWGTSIVVACVCIMLIYSIKDIDRKLKEKIVPETASSSGLFNPFYWFLSNAVYSIIIILAITGIAFSWGINDAAYSWFVEMFNKKYTLGKVELSMAGLVYSVLVLFLTQLFTGLWRRLVAEYALKESGLSTGAKETVITISVYLIWSVGILLSLSVFGLNTTSIAVAFGALSIGLGFGLQNIANNFVSGLILLFERPIQVGDVVEVGGIWGEVRKINVRSTLVQTYTNSSLIIPNSEFISATVTNWSHHDPNLRRDLLVGVAYGSDTQLVKKLMLQAADTVPGVHVRPRKPMVQFLNFGDSSLDFRLRFWSTIDEFVDTESNLRFEIDRLFREHNVVIPFPQRDVHIVSESQAT